MRIPRAPASLGAAAAIALGLGLAAVLPAVPAGVAGRVFAASPDDPAGRGREALAGAIDALGGVAAISAVDTWLVEGRGRENLSAELQGLSPGRPTWRPHEERIAVDARSFRVAWERKTPRNDLSLRWRRFVRGADSTGFYDLSAGFGRMRGIATPDGDRRSLTRRVPHLLLLEAFESGRASWRGEARFAGRVHDLVEVECADGVRLELAIARDSHRLFRARHRVPVPGAGKVPVDWEWSEWRSDPRVRFAPIGHRVLVNDAIYQEVRYSTFGGSEHEARALLTVPPNRPMPAGGPTNPPAREPSAGSPPSAEGEVAPGVHVLQAGNFTVMYVEFRDFVVAMEAPENHPGFEGLPASRDTTPVTAGFLAAIRAATPKPIRYVMLSHHHSDHLGGASVFAEAGATLLVAPGDVAAARAAVGPDLAKRVRIEPVASRKTITDGSRTLEIVNVGRNPHTDENLFAWLPGEKVLFQGDLFYYQQGGEFPPPGRETMNRFFARWLRDHRIHPWAIYGVHNDGAATPAELAAMRD